MSSITTPLQLTAVAQLSDVGNTFYVTDSFVAATDDYFGLPVIQELSNVLVGMPAANVPTVYIDYLSQISATNCPALTDCVPDSTYAIIAGIWGNNWLPVDGFIGGIVLDLAERELGQGDTSIFGQVFGAAVGYVQTTNQYINSVTNAQQFLGSTFTTMNSLTTGNLTDVNAATRAFGTDLAALGKLINLGNLDNFGLPSALLKQLYDTVGLLPDVRTALIQQGIDANLVDNINNADGFTDSVERLMYLAMTTITGSKLTDVLSVLDVTLTGLASMADLLNPKKIFPNSYQSLTVVTDTGLRGIYKQDGSVNTNLEQYLPSYVLSVAG